jgi:hypothetical protein
VDGKKQFFVSRLGSNYPLKSLVGFLNELMSCVDLRFLVECQDVTSASTALITKRGGRNAVGKALLPFRKLLPAFVQTHRAVIFATENASRSADWEMQLVWLLDDLRPCRVFSLFKGIEKDLVLVGRLYPSIFFCKKSLNSFWSMAKCPCTHYFRLKRRARHCHRPSLC